MYYCGGGSPQFYCEPKTHLKKIFPSSAAVLLESATTPFSSRAQGDVQKQSRHFFQVRGNSVSHSVYAGLASRLHHLGGCAGPRMWRRRALGLTLCYHLFDILSCFFFFCPCIFFFLICSEFCHTLEWNSHGFTCVPHPDPPPTSLSTRSP